ncbi:MAG TPA: zinc-ribbon domain-containing protein, partial [Candidatus Deferrimicrobium sp.]
MIIECQTCHARFRLDESRIKGRGARVKCRKCGDSIVVLKDSAPPPPATGGENFFDLGSAVRDSAGESPASLPPPPVGNLIPFPAPSRPAEPFAAESSSPIPEAVEQGKDEVDLAFDRFLSTGAEASSPSIGETEVEIPAPAEASVPGEREAPAGPEPRPEPDLGALTLDFGPEEKLDLPPAAELEPPFGEQPAVEPAAEFRGEGRFFISDSDILDSLQEKPRDAGAEASPGVGDISLEVSSAPVDESSSFVREPDASPPPRGNWASPTPGGISHERNVTPTAAPVIEVPPRWESEPASARPVEPPVRRESPAPESGRPRSSSGPAVAAVLAVLLAAGGYLGLTTS